VKRVNNKEEKERSCGVRGISKWLCRTLVTGVGRNCGLGGKGILFGFRIHPSTLKIPKIPKVGRRIQKIPWKSQEYTKNDFAADHSNTALKYKDYVV
jgi:hypothetical protein